MLLVYKILFGLVHVTLLCYCVLHEEINHICGVTNMSWLSSAVLIELVFSVTEWLIQGAIYQFVQISQVSINLLDHRITIICKANFK